MPNHLNDDELKQVTGGEVSNANASEADNSSNINRHSTKAVCIDCSETYIGLRGEVHEKVNMHLNTTGHSYFCYYPE